MKERRAVQQVAIEVEVPEGAPAPSKAIVWFEPKTVEEFERCAALVGGVEKLQMPDGSYYGQPASARGTDGFFSVCIHAPPAGSVAELREEPGRTPHPFFRRYAKDGDPDGR